MQEFLMVTLVIYLILHGVTRFLFFRKGDARYKAGFRLLNVPIRTVLLLVVLAAIITGVLYGFK